MTSHHLPADVWEQIPEAIRPIVHAALARLEAATLEAAGWSRCTDGSAKAAPRPNVTAYWYSADARLDLSKVTVYDARGVILCSPPSDTPPQRDDESDPPIVVDPKPE